jgi:hypothetical protein
MIADYLIERFDTKIKSYFASDDWKNVYEAKLNQINHDEPWLTLIACYAIFGNQLDINKPRLNAINSILNSSGVRDKFNFTKIHKVIVEEKLNEIIKYRNYLKKAFTKENFHLYPDRINLINKKIGKHKASFEGNTNLDLLIEGISNNRKIIIYIEAKYLSDISYQITYNPVRDQIIRNIDCGIDLVLNANTIAGFEDFYFLLLTPKVFRTDKFGGSKKTGLSQFGADKSRLYCYKMNDYKDFNILKTHLPHRELKDRDWKKIAENIGWITFEDFRIQSNTHNTILNTEENVLIQKYFDERNL